MSDDQQSPEVLRLGEHLYPMLSIVEEPDPQHPQTGMLEPVNFEYFVFLTSFEEAFNARWEIGKRSYGRLNPMHYYGGTEREANISFTLPAMTVHESAQNLRKCSELSRAVYGKYRKWNIGTNTDEENQQLREHGLQYEKPDFTMVGHRYFRANFGNLITDERVFISSFSFKINLDAGIFDYTERDWGSAAAALESLTSGANPVNSQIWEEVLPRQIDIQISMIFRHDYPLGFGGPNRVGLPPTRWAENRNRDFPHGTGEIDVQPYMSRTEGTTTPIRTAAQAHATYLTDTDAGRAEVSVAAAEAGEVNPNYGLNRAADGNFIPSEETYVPIPGRTPIGGNEPQEYRYNPETGEWVDAVSEGSE